MVQLTAQLIESFAGVFLSPMLDNPCVTPPFHRECWELYCSDAPAIAIAAPRGHAKSTALTHTFALAAALFRLESHILIVSATEELSMSHLGDIAKELRDNDDLREEFGVKAFTTDSKGEIVIQCDDGYEFRLIARGAGQKLRGLKWNGRRPGIVICDDMEEDEQVANLDRRIKFRQWVLRALLPLMRRGGLIRWHGTILHEDAMLARFMKDPTWISRLYKAHAAYDDFSQILWPEAFDEKSLKLIQRRYIQQGDAAGYSQEYLNDPLDSADAYLMKDWFLPMNDADWDSDKIIGAACDFAISKKDRSNRTAIVVGGKDLQNHLNIIDVRVGRFDALEIIEELFAVQDMHHPDIIWVESGQIWASLWPQIRKEMHVRDKYINFSTRTPITDKASRGRSLQRRMRAGGVKFPHEAAWFTGLQDECLRFTGNADALRDDQFDALALLSLGFDEFSEVEKEDFLSDDEIEFSRAQTPQRYLGRSKVTGY